MPNYKRSTNGNLFFFTVVTWKRNPIFNNELNRKLLSSVIKRVQTQYPFYNEAFVLLHDHLHCIWALPDQNYSMRWGLIKKEFTKQVYTLTGNTPQRLKNKRREGAIWQRRFWEHRIRDQRDYNNHCDYIHYNPVKHGLAHTPNEWEFSSFHRFVKNGYYTKNWCASGANFTTITAGE